MSLSGVRGRPTVTRFVQQSPTTPEIRWQNLAQQMLDAVHGVAGSSRWAFVLPLTDEGPKRKLPKDPHPDKSIDELFDDLDREIAEENSGIPAPNKPQIDPRLRPTASLLLAILRLARTFETKAQFYRQLAAPGRMTLLTTGMPVLDKTIEKVPEALVDAGFLGKSKTNAPAVLLAAEAIRSSFDEGMPFGSLNDSIRFAINRRRPIAIIAPLASNLAPALTKLRLTELRLAAMNPEMLGALLCHAYPGVDPSAAQRFPSDLPLSRLDPEDYVLALHHEDAGTALEALQRKAMPGPRTGKGLKDFPLPQQVRAPVERILTDLAAWSAGFIPWEDVSRGLLLSGPPGTGKTELARLLGKEAGFELIACSLAQWSGSGSRSGDAVKAMRATFTAAAAKAPAIVYIDELDAFGDRARAADHNSAYTDYIVGALLECLDGYSKHEGVIFVGATNHVAKVDVAIRRAGRFDTVVSLENPTAEYPLFHRQARGCAVGFQILARAGSDPCRLPAHIDHHRLLFGSFLGQTFHDPGEDSHTAPALPSAAERLWRAIDTWRIAPAQPIAIDEDNATQDATIIYPRSPIALGKERPKPVHLRFGQPEQVAHRSSLPADRESRSQSMINGS